MRLLPKLRLFAGLTAMTGVVVLSSPGVQIADAQDSSTTSSAAVESFLAQNDAQSSAGPICEGDVASRQRADEATIAKAMARMQEQVALGQAAGRPGAGDIVVLNGRGYNYAPPSPLNSLPPVPPVD